MKPSVQNILFSDYFQISPNLLEAYGTFNVSLVADLPLFIDPFLLFNSPKPEYQTQHDSIIKYLTFLRDKSANKQVSEGLLKAWYLFSEVKQTWLGFSKEGNSGSGLGQKFARALNNSFYYIFGDDTVQIARGKHLEKLCLITDGVGRDNISDFTTNLIKEYLLEYTQQFARLYLQPHQCFTFPVGKVAFNYKTEHWDSKRFYLPCVITSAKNGYKRDYVLLVPKDLLTSHETWINHNDLIDAFADVPESMLDSALRAEFNNYLMKALPHTATKKVDRRKVIGEILQQHPEFVDYYIKHKEDTGDQAVVTSNENVLYAESLFLDNFTKLAILIMDRTDFYKHDMTSLKDAQHRIACLKTAIEEYEGYQYLYDSNSRPVPTEHELSIAYRFIWLNVPTAKDGYSENGQTNGVFLTNPRDIVRIEFKLASNSRLKSYLNKLADASAEDTKNKAVIAVIFCFSTFERQNVERHLHEMKAASHEVTLINAYEGHQHGELKAMSSLPTEQNIMYPTDLLEQLNAIGENKANLRRLIELLESNGRNNLLTFVGAGMSIPFKFALWDVFLIAQGKQAGIEPEIKARISAGEYEEAAQDLLDRRGYRAFNDAIEEEYGLHKLNGVDLQGAVTYLPLLAVGPVITTNFDRLLETVFDAAKSPFQEKVWGAKADVATDALNKNERVLLKLHGDVRDSTDRTLTKNDYSRNYMKADGSGIDLTKPLPKLLHQMLVGRSLLFVGCSLKDDRTVEVLEQVASNFHSIAHYAIVEQPASDEEFQARSRFLSHHNIRPVWFPMGRYEFVEYILAYLASKANP